MLLDVKLLLIVIDAATPRVVCPAIQTGQLPVLQRLVEAGTLHESSTTIFPSITPAATTAIITGEYPARNGILGASWFDAGTKDIAYYGDDFWVVARQGFRAFLEDFLIRLNGDRLHSPTLLEMVEKDGGIAASLNYLIFKGPETHKVKVPFALTLLPGVKRTEYVNGPKVLCIGDFVTTRTPRGRPLEDDGIGMLHRFGMDDACTGRFLVEMAEDDAFPDFTVAYFADNDYRSHEVGPYQSLEVLERIDRMLGRTFDAMGGIDRALEEMYVVITSDHGHCEVLADRDRAAIHLHKILNDFDQATLGQAWKEADQIMICPNMRAAQVYFRTPTAPEVRRAIRTMLADERIDHVICRAEDLGEPDNHLWIESARGGLSFWPATGGRAHGRDAFGNQWCWRGDLQVVDAALVDGEIKWKDYPNAFERLSGVLRSEDSATLWVTAKAGCEFEVPGGEAHVGGASHGGLHALESLCPVIVAGPTRVTLPPDFRSIDIAPLCLLLMGRHSPHRVGAPRVEALP